MIYSYSKSFTKAQIIKFTRIHQELLPTSSLSNLTPKQLIQIYKLLLASPQVIMITAMENNDIQGFALTITNKTAFIWNLLCNPIRIYHVLFSIIPSLTKIIPSLFKAESRSSFKQSNSPELLFLAVQNNYQQRGVGSELLKLTEKELQKRHFNHIVIKTDAENEKGNNFYQRHHYKLQYSYNNHNRKMNMYTKKLA